MQQYSLHHCSRWSIIRASLSLCWSASVVAASVAIYISRRSRATANRPISAQHRSWCQLCQEGDQRLLCVAFCRRSCRSGCSGTASSGSNFKLRRIQLCSVNMYVLHVLFAETVIDDSLHTFTTQHYSVICRNCSPAEASDTKTCGKVYDIWIYPHPCDDYTLNRFKIINSRSVCIVTLAAQIYRR